MKEVNLVLGLVGGASVALIVNQFWLHARLTVIESYLVEIYDVVDKYVQEEVDEKFLDIVERFDEE